MFYMTINLTHHIVTAISNMYTFVIALIFNAFTTRKKKSNLYSVPTG